MLSDYRISILLPCISTNFLFECIASIQEQTLDKDLFEVVIVCDQIDERDVQRIVRSFQINYRLLSSPNPGIVATLNYGLENISSEFVARMDEDDVMLPDRLKIQLAYLQENATCVALGGQLELIDEDGLSIGEAKFKNIVTDSIFDLFHSSPVAHPAVMMRRTAVDDIGGYREFVAEDWDLWVRLSQLGRIENVPAKVLKYRIHKHQLSRNKMYQQSHARIMVATSHFARKMGFPDLPESKSQINPWFANVSCRLRQESNEYRSFEKWTKKMDSYQEARMLFVSRNSLRAAIIAFIVSPNWFIKDLLKKFRD